MVLLCRLDEWWVKHIKLKNNKFALKLDQLDLPIMKIRVTTCTYLWYFKVEQLKNDFKKIIVFSIRKPSEIIYNFYFQASKSGYGRRFLWLRVETNLILTCD